MAEDKSIRTFEPMWPSVISLIAAGALFAEMPDELGFAGPPWLLLAAMLGLIIPGEIAHKLGKHKICKIVSYLTLVMITLAMIRSVFLHVLAITQKSLPPDRLLVAAIILWITNILVFAGWYWRLDAGGPHQRSMRDSHTDGAFLFPQMTLNTNADPADDAENWSPHFIDYLFLSFNTSTALSPTDVPVLSRWAKVLMMIQSALSLTVVVLLAARAVNIL